MKIQSFKMRSRLLACIVVLMILIASVSIFSIGVAGADSTASTVTLTLSDSYGDGWNGNAIDVYVNGTKNGSYTFSNGYSATCSFSYDSKNTYEFRWVKGSYASECSFTIKLGGEVLLSATKTQCGSYSSGYSLLTIDREVDYDLDGEFAGGTGTAADPYLVATKAQLNNVRNHSGSHFRQVRNVAFTASDFSASGDFYNDGKGWEPIGADYNSMFFGSYDGNGCTIDGLTISIDSSEVDYVGLFGYANCDIANLNLTNIYYTMNGVANVGGIIAQSYFAEIIGCSVTGVISAEEVLTVGGIAAHAEKVRYCESDVFIDAIGSTFIDAGGIAGNASDVSHCKNNGNITVTGASDATVYVGGIVSTTGNSGITDCQNNGSITIDGGSDMYVLVGGIVASANGDITRCENNGILSSSGSSVFIGGIAGEISNYSNYHITVSECVNRANVSAVYPTERGYVGGIVGELGQNSIKNCYVTAVTLTSRGTTDAVAGGITGHMYDGSYITNCYSIVNTVTVNTSASGWARGGIAGRNYGTVEKSYYRYTYGAGYNGGSFSATRYSNLSSYTSSSTYSGFDFSSVWKMDTGTYGYAVLRMESGHTHSLSYKAATVTYDVAGNLENWYCSTCQTYFSNSAGTRYATTDMLKSDPLPREGKCGNDVRWRLTYEGELTIRGSGEMDNYTDATPAPWYECREKVKSVTVDQNVTSIGNNAFKGCTNLTDFTFADSIQTIGENAFAGCSSITQLQIPKCVTNVGDNAFSSIDNLIVCFEGGSPSFGGSNVFSGTSASIYYPSEDSTWTTDVMQDQTGSITLKSYESIDDIIIASGTYSSIKWTVSLSGILSIIGEYSGKEIMDFSSYSQRPNWEVYKDLISSVELVNISRVGNYAFYQYPVLNSVDFGAVEEVGSYAFCGCSSLEKVFLEGDNRRAIIEKYAFGSCASLKQLAFPDSATIQDYAFYGCSNLNEIYVTTFSSYITFSTLSSYAFAGVKATVFMPINGHFRDFGDFGGDLTWEQAAYGPCGSNAFWSYDGNTSTITIAGAGAIASYWSGSQYPWYGLRSSVTTVVFEDRITHIPSYALEYMSSIKQAILPNTLQILNCNTFNDCKSLNNLIIPASVTEFGYNYFNRCDSLTDVYYMGTAEEWGNIKNNTDIGKYVHYLILMDQTATCTTAGTEAYYQFDDTSVYSGYYNLDKQPTEHLGVVEALGHDYETTWTTDVEPTCLMVGSKSHHCSRCDDKAEVTEVPANGHTPITDAAVPPTELTPGLSEGIHCDVCGVVIIPQEEIPALGLDSDFKIRGASLSLSNDINIVYKALIPENYTDAYMVFTFAGEDYTVYGTKNADGSYSYMFTEILPQMIGENIRAELFAKNEFGDSVSVCVEKYSVLTYCKNKLESTSDVSFKTMLSDLLVYAKAAQIYSGYNTDALVTEGLEEIMAPTKFTSVDSSANKQKLEGEADAGAKWRSAGLLYENAMAMYIKFAATDIESLEVRISINGESVSYGKDDFILDSDGYYKLYFRGIYFTEFDDAVVATFHRNGVQVGQTLNYSVNTYVYKNQNHSDSATRELMRATYNYGASAKLYAESK